MSGGLSSPAGSSGTGALASRALLDAMPGLPDQLMWEERAEAEEAGRLSDKAFFETLIDRFATAHPGADRAALVSFWSQYYFARLVIPALAFSLGEEDEPLPLRLDDLRVCFREQDGTPSSFHMPAKCGARPDCFRLSMANLLGGHVGPLGAVLKRHSGLSEGLFWENATWYLGWAMGEAQKLLPACGPALQALLNDQILPARCRSCLGRMACLQEPKAAPTRKVCCLRYQIPGMGKCEGICPKVI